MPPRMTRLTALANESLYQLPLDVVQKFLTLQGCTTEGFNPKQAGFYFGMQLEELAEKFEAVASAEPDMTQRGYMSQTITSIKHFASRFKSGHHQFAIQHADLEETLDGDLDLAWVSFGAAFSTSTDTFSAFGEVARANLDKFPNDVATLDANGKVMKPVGWAKPDLTPFLEPMDNAS